MRHCTEILSAAVPKY